MKLHTLTQKITAKILCISIIVLLLFHLLFPTIFYTIMKPYLFDQVANAVETAALRQSYIWRNNTQLHDMSSSMELKKLIRSYYSEPDNSAAIRRRLLTYLPILENGRLDDNTGYIAFTNYILLFTSRGDLFYNENSATAAQALRDSSWYQNVDRQTTFKSHIPVLTAEDGTQFFCVIGSFWVDNINCFAVNMVRLNDVLDQLTVFDDWGITDYLICNNSGIIYSNLGDATSIDLTQCPAKLLNGKQYEVLRWEDRNQTLFSTLCSYKAEDLHLLVRVTRDLFLSPYQTSFRYFQLVLCGLTLLLLVSFIICLRHPLKRLTALEKKMNRVRKGDYSVVAQDSSQDEIGNLTATFQIMLEKIKEDMKKEEQMQYTLMVSAIDPHYIYNTLNSITALAEMGRSSDVAAMNTALIGTLKDRMKMKNYKSFDTVRAEQQALEQYMVIQSYLCYLKIDYSFEVSPEDQDLIIPKNIIQPLVENAIKHGILCLDYDENEVKTGVIRVKVALQDDKICIEVRDNGEGMDEATLSRFFRNEPAPEQDMTHVGICNVRMRLNYLYKTDYQMDVISHPGEGCCIRILLPPSALFEPQAS